MLIEEIEKALLPVGTIQLSTLVEIANDLFKTKYYNYLIKYYKNKGIYADNINDYVNNIMILFVYTWTGFYYKDSFMIPQGFYKSNEISNYKSHTALSFNVDDKLPGFDRFKKETYSIIVGFHSAELFIKKMCQHYHIKRTYNELKNEFQHQNFSPLKIIRTEQSYLPRYIEKINLANPILEIYFHPYKIIIPTGFHSGNEQDEKVLKLFYDSVKKQTEIYNLKYIHEEKQIIKEWKSKRIIAIKEILLLFATAEFDELLPYIPLDLSENRIKVSLNTDNAKIIAENIFTITGVQFLDIYIDNKKLDIKNLDEIAQTMWDDKVKLDIDYTQKHISTDLILSSFIYSKELYRICLQNKDKSFLELAKELDDETRDLSFIAKKFDIFFQHFQQYLSIKNFYLQQLSTIIKFGFNNSNDRALKSIISKCSWKINFDYSTISYKKILIYLLNN